MTNVFYFNHIQKIGGTEQFLYELAKKYKDYDITILYKTADMSQVKRLKKLVRVKQYRGEKIQCDKIFFNFSVDIIDNVEANEYIFVDHAIYQELKQIPPITHPKLTKFICVSQYAVNMLEQYGEKLRHPIKASKCYNPLTLEPKEKVLHIVSAGRLDDPVKGGDRTRVLIEALDRYCEKTGRHYIFTIFTNPTAKMLVTSKNVAIMPPRVDVRPYIADADFLVQLSNDMETYGYSINEAWGYGVPVVRTPLTVCKELPLTEDMSLVCNWDMSNVDEIVKEMFERQDKKFTYTPPVDGWADILNKTKSTYKEELKMKYKVEALKTYEEYEITDKELGRIPKEGETFIVTKDRLDVLLGENDDNRVYVKVIEEIKETKKRTKGGK